MRHDTFVLDCSVTMAWCFEDEVCDYSENILDSLFESTAVVPTIWPLEVCNVLLMAVQKKRLTKVKAAAFIDRLGELPIEMGSTKPLSAIASIFQLGNERKITSYDAAYLDLAIARDCPLATLDKPLAKAAKAAEILVLS